MSVHASHKLFTVKDFTQEEIDRKNILAVQVIDFDLKHCKVCGRTERELSKHCGRLHARGKQA